MLSSMVLAGLVMITMPFASAAQVTVSLPPGSSALGCEDFNTRVLHSIPSNHKPW